MGGESKGQSWFYKADLSTGLVNNNGTIETAETAAIFHLLYQICKSLVDLNGSTELHFSLGIFTGILVH